MHSDIKAEFEKNNVNISYNSTHVISTSGPFQFKLKQSDYFNFEWKNQHIFAAFYNKLDLMMNLETNLMQNILIDEDLRH
ncbi:hypothetical protein [Mycoplasmopsis caviae]|uniref:hypothetical protein n=1 Tax=Mycoplasmopsis caviae TaxID=55603 RepID=UPI0013DF0A70|nr:hypothetical protein [Mycoplasmopsis caviae]